MVLDASNRLQQTSSYAVKCVHAISKNKVSEVVKQLKEAVLILIIFASAAAKADRPEKIEFVLSSDDTVVFLGEPTWCVFKDPEHSRLFCLTHLLRNLKDHAFETFHGKRIRLEGLEP